MSKFLTTFTHEVTMMDPFVSKLLFLSTLSLSCLKTDGLRTIFHKISPIKRTFIPSTSFSKYSHPSLFQRTFLTPLHVASSSSSSSSPEILPFDPRYSALGTIGNSTFIISRTGSPTKEELSNENIVKILFLNCTDLEVNTLVWKCLGYRFNPETLEWDNDEVFPKWKQKYPSPPDLIGMQRIYTKEIDKPSLKANQALVKSVPVDNKQSLKGHLKPHGFKGYQYAELTPNKTRRAQCANWLIYYREELFGYSVEELKERRRLKQEQAEAEKRKREEGSGEAEEDEWKPPLKQVY